MRITARRRLRYKRWLAWGAAGLLSLLLTVTASLWAERFWQDRHPQYRDNFATTGGESQQKSWQSYGGTWQVANGAMQNISDDRGAKLMNGSTHWHNYVVEADVQLLGEGGDAGIIVRASQEEVGVDAYHGYFAGIRNLDDTLLLGRADFGWHQFRKVPLHTALRIHTWYHLKFVVYDCWLAASARSDQDEVTTASTYDPGCLSQGRFGLQSYSTAAAWRNLTLSPATRDDLVAMLGPVLPTEANAFPNAQAGVDVWTDPRLLEPMLRELQIQKSSLNAQPIAQLRLLDPKQTSPVTIHGVVTMASPKLFLQDASGGLAVSQYHSDIPLQIGDTVEATGNAENHEFSSILRDAEVRLLFSHSSVPPLSMTAARAALGSFDDQFVETEGVLIGRTRTGKQSFVLKLEDENQSFLAYVQNPGISSQLNALRMGSRLRVRGICVTDRSYARDEAPFAILMRSAKDVWMVAPPSWWSKWHVIEMLSALALCSFTLQYTFATVKRAQLRAVMDERERLAMEMHDTLAQSFAGIGFRMEALCEDTDPNSLLHAQLECTVDLIHFGHREARRNIAALRPGNLEKLGLAKSIEVAARTIVQNGPIQIHLSIRGEQRDIPLRVADPFLRISQEAIANAVRHGHPTNIYISLIGSIAEFVGAESGGRRRSEEKSKSRTFPPRLEIPQVQRDSHFFHRPCCDEPYFDFPVQEEIADSRPDGLVCCLRRQ